MKWLTAGGVTSVLAKENKLHVHSKENGAYTNELDALNNGYKLIMNEYVDANLDSYLAFLVRSN